MGALFTIEHRGLCDIHADCLCHIASTVLAVEFAETRMMRECGPSKHRSRAVRGNSNSHCFLRPQQSQTGALLFVRRWWRSALFIPAVAREIRDIRDIDFSLK